MIKFSNAFDLIKLVSTILNQKIKFNVKNLKVKKTHIRHISIYLYLNFNVSHENDFFNSSFK